MPVMSFSTEERVRFHELGADGRLRPDALLDWLQETAGRHAQVLGRDVLDLQQRGLSWALARQRVSVRRWPVADDRVQITTWAAERERSLLYRDFRLTDADGSEVASASTAWVVLDLATRAAVADPGPLVEGVAFENRRALTFATRTIAAVRQPTVEVAVRPRWCDLDLNGHVNHARLLALVLESADDERLDSHLLVDVDLLFRAECRHGDELIASAETVAPDRLRHSLVRPADGVEILRAETVWTSR